MSLFKKKAAPNRITKLPLEEVTFLSFSLFDFTKEIIICVQIFPAWFQSSVFSVMLLIASSITNFCLSIAFSHSYQLEVKMIESKSNNSSKSNTANSPFPSPFEHPCISTSEFALNTFSMTFLSFGLTVVTCQQFSYDSGRYSLIVHLYNGCFPSDFPP